MANNTTLKDGNGTIFTAESIDIGSGVQRTSTAANLRVANTDVATSNPVPMLLTVGGSAISSTNAVPIYDAYQAPTTATWTSSTAANTALTLATAGMDTVIFTLSTPGGLTAGRPHLRGL